jgi:hypothetical protein
MPEKGEVAAAEAVVNDVRELDLERVGAGESLVRWLSCAPLSPPLSAVSRRAPRRRCAASATGILQRWRGSKRLLVEEEKGTRVVGRVPRGLLSRIIEEHHSFGDAAEIVNNKL